MPHRFLRDRSGASAVEFALIAAPLALLLLGSLEYGRLLYLRQAIDDTAIAAARCAGVLEPGCTQDGAYDLVATRSHIVGMAAGRGIDIALDDIAVDRAATCAGITGFSRVTIAYSIDSAFPVEMAGSSEACFPNQ